MNWNQVQQWAWGWIRWLQNRIFTDEQRFSTLEAKVFKMSDILDDLKTKFEAYQTLANSTLADLRAKVAALTAGQLDPAKAQALEDEMDAAAAALAPPAP